MNVKQRKSYEELIKGAWQMDIYDCYPELMGHDRVEKRAANSQHATPNCGDTNHPDNVMKGRRIPL